MDEIFGNEDLNLTAEAAVGHVAHTYTADEIALMLGALGACVASIIYGFKNVKRSSCCLGLIKIEQRTELPISKDSIIQESHV